MNFLIPLISMIVVIIALSPESAQAQILNLTINDSLGGACGANGSVGASESVFGNRPGDPSTQAATVCNTDGLFTRFFCLIETTLGLVIARTFCAIRDAWLEPFGAMMVLLMAVTGMAFITGILRFTMKEITAILMKMGLVTLFVTNADVALNIAYQLFLGIMKATVLIITNGFAVMPTSASELPYARGGNVNMSGGDGFKQTEQDVDTIFESIMGAGQAVLPEFCSVYGLMLALVLIVPFATMFVMFALVSFFGFFARAAYGYVYALVMVTFLVAAMPIFVSFALFKVTEDLFAHWYKYIGSQVIQIFIVFGLMAFASMIDFRGFFNSFNDIIVKHEITYHVLNMQVFSMNSCSICEKPNFRMILGGAVPIIDDPACSAPTDPSKPGMAYLDIIKNETFIRFMVVNGVALYLLTRIMDNFMKIGPDMAKMLGGARLSHAIGGIATQGANSVTSPLHRGTVNFEQGMAHADKHDDTDPNKGERGLFDQSGLGRAMRSMQGGTEAVTEGQVVENDEAYVSNRQALYEQNKELAEKYEAASEKSKEAEEKYDLMVQEYVQGKATIEQVAEAGENYQRVQYEERKIDNEHQQLAEQQAVTREDNAKKEYVAEKTEGGAGTVFDASGGEGERE